MPAPPQIIDQIMEAVNPLRNSNAVIHIDLIAFQETFIQFSYAFGPLCLPMKLVQ